MSDDEFSDSEMWSAVRQRNQRKRASNREHAPKVLSQAGIVHTSHNGNAHLVVKDRWDFWPGTGKFIDRQTKKAGRGVYNLVRVVKEAS